MRDVESIRDPKKTLRDALLAASETKGRRRAQFERDFGRHRSLLLQRLDRNGPINQIASWQRLKTSIEECLSGLELARGDE